MANSSINLVDLDFNAFKESLKTYLSSQTKFRDYDFEGSNLNVLLDVLSYNTYLNSFYLNMVASEMFLDTAQLRDSIVSHAKELNYMPRSFRSAFANVNITITPSTSTSTVIIPSKTSFTARIGANNFNFVTDGAIAVTTSNNGVFHANNVTIYEGSYVTDTFVKNTIIDNQRFVLTNPNIDTTSIEVVVTENSGANVYSYMQAYSLFGATSNSQIFFMQPAENNQYELVFGNDVYGRDVRNGAVVDVTYRSCNGELPNGADTFVNNSAIDGHSNVAVNINTGAISGAVSETDASIKFNAPRSFQTQERAITENDYKTLLLREFPEIVAMSVYGGEKVDPPQYGRVIIALDTSDTDGVPDIKKQIYKRYLSDKTPLGFSVEIVNPIFVYLLVDSSVVYNYNSTNLSEDEIKTKVRVAINTYNDTYLNDFNSEIKFSKFLKEIDDSDPSILNNDTVIRPYFKLVPSIGSNTSFEFSFNTEVLNTTPTSISHPIASDRGVYSTSFISDGLSCQLEDDGNGNIRVVKVTTTEHIELKKVGTIDYTTGSVVISNLKVSSYDGSGIKFIIKPIKQDYSVDLDKILVINPFDVSVNMVASTK
jgi:hypothetical protein